VLSEELLGYLDIWKVHIPESMAIAAVALIGYIFGRRTRGDQTQEMAQARRELKRAKLVAKQLEKIADSVRKDLATHRSSVAIFKDRIAKLTHCEADETTWQHLCKEAEEMLKPTLRLAMQMSLAYDEIRQQTTQLMTFTEVRTDPLTGVSNRRALDEMLNNLIAMFNRYENPFTIAIVDIDHFKQINDLRGHLHGDRTLQRFARLLDDNARETDFVARYGGEEFVVIMPHTTLEGASIFAERLRQTVQNTLPLTISGGLARATEKDSPQTLLSRADAALYSAKAAGRNRMFRHDGDDIEPIPLLEEEAGPLQREDEPSEAEAAAEDGTDQPEEARPTQANGTHC